MLTIKIKIEKEILIDDEDRELVNGYDWYLGGSKKAYVLAHTPKGLIYMHRLIMGNPEGLIDHINGITTDNRKSNLRIVDFSQNRMNAKKEQGLTSIYKGVHKKAPHRNWSVQVGRIGIGTFKEERHAAMAYDLWAKDMYGEFALLNFK